MGECSGGGGGGCAWRLVSQNAWWVNFVCLFVCLEVCVCICGKMYFGICFVVFKVFCGVFVEVEAEAVVLLLLFVVCCYCLLFVVVVCCFCGC